MNNNEDEIFIVRDLDGFIDSARILVFNNFGKSNQESSEIDYQIDNSEKPELDKVLSFDESAVICKQILKKQINKKNKNVRYLVNDNIFLLIIQSLNDRMVSNVLNSLVNKGLVESAYDSESNDFVFWIKNNNIGEKNE